MSSAYRGRFAPSPTGRLHFGSLVAAVASHAQARQQRGTWLIRMEDLDRPREVPGMAKALIEDLAAFGMVSDEPIVLQSQRDDLYTEALGRLSQRGSLFDCGCKRSDLRGLTAYPGTCREGLGPGKQARTVRVKVDSEPIALDDLVQGPFAQILQRDIGDFIVRRADGLFAYQLAVVVDDADQGITEIVRGADLLDSTPRQIYLQQLLDYAQPSYLHVPVAVDENGAKLSKQAFAQPVDPTQPIAGLSAAWRFLGQPPMTSPSTTEQFWRQAIDCWQPGRIPSRQSIAISPPRRCN